MDPTAVGNQIDRILRSHSFASKGQLRKLLEILFANIDSQASLNADRVIQEMWPAETRTKRAADVATEINRLRNALESYYDGEGKNDPITICLPKRSAQATNGPQEKRWIAAMLRGGTDGQAEAEAQALAATQAREESVPAARVSPIQILKFLVPATVFGVLIYLFIPILVKHDQPQSARVDGPVLRIMNADGKELWSKSFRDGLWSEYYDQGMASRVWFGDLDGDGRSEVLLLYHSAITPKLHSSTLICYSDQGKEKWRWTPGRDLPELQGAPPIYRIFALVVLKAAAGKPRRIVATSGNDPWWPDQVAIIDTKGKTISEYWHSGHLNHLMLADLDGSGQEDIIATGISNGYHQATMVVLDPDHVSGASTETARPELQIHGMGTAQEKLRLLFTRSDLNKTLYVYNAGGEVAVQNGSVQLSIEECLQPARCPIWYQFDKRFNLVTCYADEQFRTAHAAFYAKGKDAHRFSPEEQTEFEKVRCLVGCKTEFVLDAVH